MTETMSDYHALDFGTVDADGLQSVIDPAARIAACIACEHVAGNGKWARKSGLRARPELARQQLAAA